MDEDPEVPGVPLGWKAGRAAPYLGLSGSTPSVGAEDGAPGPCQGVGARAPSMGTEGGAPDL